jgi:hypothetical protein
VCFVIPGHDPHMPLELRTLTLYEHLQHCFMLCVNHFNRGIHKLGNNVSPAVRAAMHSLVSAYPLPDLESTKKLAHPQWRSSCSRCLSLFTIWHPLLTPHIQHGCMTRKLGHNLSILRCISPQAIYHWTSGKPVRQPLMEMSKPTGMLTAMA